MIYSDMLNGTNGIISELAKTNQLEFLKSGNPINNDVEKTFTFLNSQREINATIDQLNYTLGDVATVLLTKYANKWNGLYKGFLSADFNLTNRTSETYTQKTDGTATNNLTGKQNNKVSAYDSNTMVDDTEQDTTNVANATTNGNNQYTKQVKDNSMIAQNLRNLTQTSFYDIMFSDIRNDLFTKIMKVGY